MFGFIKDKIKKIYTTVTQGLTSLFSQGSFDESFLKQLSTLLIAADTGVKTTQTIIESLKESMTGKTVTDLAQAKEALDAILLKTLAVATPANPLPRVLLLVGINGSGKTSFIAKYANLLKGQGKRVLVVAGDTFRAAATEQLGVWAQRIGVDIAVGRDNQDPASLIFDACGRFSREGYDHLIIDTAGRLQTKANLMRELEKIKKTVQKQLPHDAIETWLTIDAMLGQNSLAQAEVFYDSTAVSGMVLTKLDGTGKGGIVFAIVDKLKVPLVYVTFGESMDDIKPFDAREYVSGLLNS